MERKIPWYCPSAGSAHWVDPPNNYLFAHYPLYSGDAQVLVNYAIKTLGYKRIALIYQNDDYGKLGLVGAKKELAKHNMKLAAEVPVQLAETDMRPHVMLMKKTQAEAAIMFVTPGHVARLLGTGKALLAPGGRRFYAGHINITGHHIDLVKTEFGVF